MGCCSQLPLLLWADRDTPAIPFSCPCQNIFSAMQKKLWSTTSKPSTAFRDTHKPPCVVRVSHQDFLGACGHVTGAEQGLAFVEAVGALARKAAVHEGSSLMLIQGSSKVQPTVPGLLCVLGTGSGHPSLVLYFSALDTWAHVFQVNLACPQTVRKRLSQLPTPLARTILTSQNLTETTPSVIGTREAGRGLLKPAK